MFFDDDRPDTEPRQLERSPEPDWAAADDDHLRPRLVLH